MVEVRQEAFSALLPLLPRCDSNVEPLAVLLGNNPGRVFVDDITVARRALIWAQGIEGFYLAGQPRQGEFWPGVQRACRQVLGDQQGASGAGSAAEVSGLGEGWDLAIASAFAGHRLEAWRQLVFTGPDPYSEQSWPPPSARAPYELRLVDRELLSDLQADPDELLRASINQYWATPANFLAVGVGAAVLSNGRVVSICHSGFVAGATHALNIETAAPFRRRGLGQASAVEVLRLCNERGLEPYWDCMADNTASAALARKLGLKLRREYTCYSIPLGSCGDE